MIIVIGSFALSYWFPGHPYKDIDLIMHESDFHEFTLHENVLGYWPTHTNKYKVITKNKLQYEVEIISNDSDHMLISLAQDTITDSYLGLEYYVPSVNILYLTKLSHIHCYHGSFEKTLNHIRLMSPNITDFSPLEMQYFDARRAEAIKRTKHKTPSLKESNNTFFNRSKAKVKYIFVHDDIHEAVKHFDRPVYEMMKTDYSVAACDAELFHQLPHDLKVKSVQEEAYVIGLERMLITGKMDDAYQAYKYALIRICTNLCSGFFRDFATNNYHEILSSYSDTFVLKFINALKDQKVAFMDENTYNKAVVEKTLTRMEALL